MNILLISQCSKKALTETRRILDQFAERRGERTWQTPITQDGLDTVRRLLRQSARKNTAVACHWIRGRDHSELLWVVGDTRQLDGHPGTLDQPLLLRQQHFRQALAHRAKTDYAYPDLVHQLLSPAEKKLENCSRPARFLPAFRRVVKTYAGSCRQAPGLAPFPPTHHSG